MGPFAGSRRGYCGCPCAGSFWGGYSLVPLGRDELVEEMEDYKTRLEGEISALERRIKALREREKE